VILVLYAHPYPTRSRACAALLGAIRDYPDLQVRSLYDLYPDFDIDGAAERAALEAATLVVWLHPFYWYGTPALLKHWLDHVLADAWTDLGGLRLKGKDCLWVTTAAGGVTARDYEAPLRQCAADCGMNWLEPFQADGSREAGERELNEAGARLRARLDDWSKARNP
jgi:glutathione-regulated potassium-efflux system ancillary protein KefF